MKQISSFLFLTIQEVPPKKAVADILQSRPLKNRRQKDAQGSTSRQRLSLRRCRNQRKSRKNTGAFFRLFHRKESGKRLEDLTFQVNQLTEQLIRRRNNLGVCLKTTLSGNHFNKFLR